MRLVRALLLDFECGALLTAFECFVSCLLLQLCLSLASLHALLASVWGPSVRCSGCCTAASLLLSLLLVPSCGVSGGQQGPTPSPTGSLIYTVPSPRPTEQVRGKRVKRQPIIIPILITPVQVESLLVLSCFTSAIYLASCCIFLTPIVFLSFAACSYLYSKAPWAPWGAPRGSIDASTSKTPWEKRGALRGPNANRLMTLADLTLSLTLDLLDLAAAFSLALSAGPPLLLDSSTFPLEGIMSL